MPAKYLNIILALSAIAFLACPFSRAEFTYYKIASVRYPERVADLERGKQDNPVIGNNGRNQDWSFDKISNSDAYSVWTVTNERTAAYLTAKYDRNASKATLIGGSDHSEPIWFTPIYGQNPYRYHISVHDKDLGTILYLTLNNIEDGTEIDLQNYRPYDSQNWFIDNFNSTI